MSLNILLKQRLMKINVTQYIDRTTEIFPDKIAVDDTHQSLTFGQLRKQAQAIAISIIEAGLSNKPVAVYMPKSCDMVVSFAAINYSGNFYVPLDTKSPETRMKSIFESLNSELVLTNKTHYNRLKTFYDGKIICIDDIDGCVVTSHKIEQALDRIIDTDRFIPYLPQDQQEILRELLFRIRESLIISTGLFQLLP
jgi:non-ribosomal peptide synthetase component F